MIHGIVLDVLDVLDCIECVGCNGIGIGLYWTTRVPPVPSCPPQRGAGAGVGVGMSRGRGIPLIEKKQKNNLLKFPSIKNQKQSSNA